MYLCEVVIVSQLCISFPYVLHGLCEDYLTCDIAFNAVMPLSRASTRGRYSRIEGVTAPASSSTARGGRQYRYGTPLKPLEKLPYEMTVEENKKIVQKEVKDFFEGAKAERHPPPEEKVDPVKAKRTLAALTKPPKSPPKG